MLQVLRRNFGLKLFAFAVALGGWAYFRFLASPSITTPFDQRLVIAHADTKVVERSFAVDVDYIGRQGDLVVTSIDVTPRQVDVRGNDSTIGQIASIRVPVPILSEPASYDRMIAPEVFGPGADSSALTISPNLIRVQVVFARGSGAINH